MSEIKVENLSVQYKKHKLNIVAVDNFSYTFEDGRFYSILGASGCGKTSLLRSLVGLIDYDGKILINGVDAFDLTISERNFSLVSQNFALYPHLNIFFNLAFPLKNKGYSREQIEKRVYDMAEKLGLKHCLLRKPKELSVGQQQRICLGRALIKMPSVLLLDEPLSNLDPKNRTDELKLIKSVCEQMNVTLIYVTHNYNEAINISDTLLVMNEGKLVYTCSNKEALNSKNKYLMDVKQS